MSLRRACTVVVAGALLAAIPAGPAAAAPEPEPWVMAECVNGSLSTLTYEPRAKYFTVAGTATECQAPGPTTRPVGFGIATFEGSSSVYGDLMDWNIRMFPPAGDPWQPASVAFGAAAVPARPGRFGVCIVERPARAPGTPIWVALRATPVACLLVTVAREGDADPTATTAPLPTDSPMLSRGARIPATYTGTTEPYTSEPDDGGSGGCGTCF